MSKTRKDRPRWVRAAKMAKKKHAMSKHDIKRPEKTVTQQQKIDCIKISRNFAFSTSRIENSTGKSLTDSRVQHIAKQYTNYHNTVVSHTEWTDIKSHIGHASGLIISGHNDNVVDKKLIRVNLEHFFAREGLTNKEIDTIVNALDDKYLSNNKKEVNIVTRKGDVVNFRFTTIARIRSEKRDDVCDHVSDKTIRIAYCHVTRLTDVSVQWGDAVTITSKTTVNTYDRTLDDKVNEIYGENIARHALARTYNTNCTCTWCVPKSKKKDKIFDGKHSAKPSRSSQKIALQKMIKTR